MLLAVGGWRVAGRDKSHALRRDVAHVLRLVVPPPALALPVLQLCHTPVHQATSLSARLPPAACRLTLGACAAARVLPPVCVECEDGLTVLGAWRAAGRGESRHTEDYDLSALNFLHLGRADPCSTLDASADLPAHVASVAASPLPPRLWNLLPRSVPAPDGMRHAGKRLAVMASASCWRLRACLADEARLP